MMMARAIAPIAHAKPAARLVEVARDGAQRLIEAESHVPGLAREDREDRGQLRPEHAAGKRRDEEYDRKGEVTEDRHRLKNVKERYQHHLGATAFAGQRRVGEGKN